jgi:hypothetical protein
MVNRGSSDYHTGTTGRLTPLDGLTNALIGYARVSTDEQDTFAQISELRRAGCVTLFEDRASGASRSRRNWPALAAVGQGTPSWLCGSIASHDRCHICWKSSKRSAPRSVFSLDQ